MSHCQSIPNPAMINAHMDFTLNILRENGLNSSTIFSPISITVILAMVYLGAKENTAAQIRKIIANGEIDDNEIHCHFSSILDYIKTNNINGEIPEVIYNIKKFPIIDYENSTISFDFDSPQKKIFWLNFVNRIYIQNDFQLSNNYIDGIKRYYGNDKIEKLDFRAATDAAKKINEFVEDATHKKIQNIVTPESIDSMIGLILINAIYFKAEWNEYFTETFAADFYFSLNESRKVEMMSLNSWLPYYENEEYKIVGLPYKDCEFTMFIILPIERCGLQKLINNFDASNLTKNLGKTENFNVKINFPRFRIDSEFDISKTLKNLGITEAFNENANFSGILNEGGNLKISDIKHKAFIKINEYGTEAAASTFLQIYYARGKINHHVFIANHPFMFIIADKKFNFLFAGTHF